MVRNMADFLGGRGHGREVWATQENTKEKPHRQECLCHTSSGEGTVEADVCPFDKALDLADAVLRNDQKVAGAQVRERLRGGGAHGGLEVQDFGFRQIGADSAEENDLRMFGAG